MGEIFDEELMCLELSSVDDVRDIKLYDKTVQLVAVINKVEPVSTTGNGNKYIKGNIKTENDIISFIIWNECIDIHEAKLKRGTKCLLENLYIKPFQRKFDKDVTTDFQCNIQTNSIITWISSSLGSNENTENENVYQKCALEDIGRYEGLVEIDDVYVRSLPSTFQESSTSSYKLCSITNGSSTFEVHFACDLDMKFQKGEAVTVKGLVNHKGSPPWIIIKSPDHFCKKDGVKPLSISQVVTASKAVKRRSDVLNDAPAKKPKKD